MKRLDSNVGEGAPERVPGVVREDEEARHTRPAAKGVTAGATRGRGNCEVQCPGAPLGFLFTDAPGTAAVKCLAWLLPDSYSAPPKPTVRLGWLASYTTWTAGLRPLLPPGGWCLQPAAPALGDCRMYRPFIDVRVWCFPALLRSARELTLQSTCIPQMRWTCL